MRILILSHNHPELGAGGGERAAYSLFQRAKNDPNVTEAIFVARAEPEMIGHSAFFGSFRGRPDEILAAPPPVDGFTFQSYNYDLLKQLVEELVSYTRPDVVHIHHFIYWGLDILELFKQFGVRVVFTFHEYAAICAHFGQMVKTDGRLCYAASPAECSQCFPSKSAGKFFIREVIGKAFFAHVDAFVAPSAFLKDRYVAWGLPADRIVVIENVMDQGVLQKSCILSDRRIPRIESGRRLTLSFFGQITPYKGVDVLLEACASLPKKIRKRIEVRIHGENKHFQDTDFSRNVDRLLEETHDVVRMMGAYRNQDVISLMRGSDWIIIPSIWWENSPIVIQEARMAGRPIIYSDIGGMSEKAEPDVDLPFPAGSPGALADIIRFVAESGGQLTGTEVLSGSGQSRSAIDAESYHRHTTLYMSTAASGKSPVTCLVG